MTLSADDLKELRAKAEAATPGPWVTVEGANSHVFELRITRAKDEYACVAFSDNEDAAFIAALNPATALSLIAAAELNAELVEGLEEARDHYDMLVRIANGGAVYEIEKSSGKRVRRTLSEVLAIEADAGSRHCRQAIAKAKGSA